jgi:hypothetical protein
MLARERRQWEISPLDNAALAVRYKHTFASRLQVKTGIHVVI